MSYNKPLNINNKSIDASEETIKKLEKNLMPGFKLNNIEKHSAIKNEGEVKTINQMNTHITHNTHNTNINKNFTENTSLYSSVIGDKSAANNPLNSGKDEVENILTQINKKHLKMNTDSTVKKPTKKHKSKFCDESVEISINLSQVGELKDKMDVDYSELASFSNLSNKTYNIDQFVFEETERVKQKKEEKYGSQKKEMIKQITMQKQNTM